MKDFKEKAKKFWKKHWPEIVGAGLGTTIGLYIIYNEDKAYKNGYIDGVYGGFHVTLKWLEEHYPETKATELWENYKTTNPDKVVHWKGPGKWE